MYVSSVFLSGCVLLLDFSDLVSNHFDLFQLFRTQRSGIQYLEILQDLLGPAGTNQNAGDTLLVQDPFQCHHRQVLSSCLGHFIQFPKQSHLLFRQIGLVQEPAIRPDAAVFRDPVEIPVRQLPFGQRRKCDQAFALFNACRSPFSSGERSRIEYRFWSITKGTSSLFRISVAFFSVSPS